LNILNNTNYNGQLQINERLPVGDLFKPYFVFDSGVRTWQNEASPKDEIFKPAERFKELSGADAGEQRGQRVPKQSELRLSRFNS